MAVLPAEETGVRPRYRVPSDVAVILRADLLALTDEIVTEIRRRVPEFARPKPAQEARLRAAVETGVTRFVDQLAGLDVARDPRPYQELGEWEQHEGRGLDALQSAYRLGARLVWRRLTEIGLRDGIAGRALWRLGEELFVYIEEVAAQSVAGHAEAARRTGAGGVPHHRRELVELLLTARNGASGERLRSLAAAARWRVPSSVSCVTLGDGPGESRGISPPVTADVLMDLERPEPCLIVPDPEGPGRMEMVENALAGTLAVIGPPVALADAALSFRLSLRLLARLRGGSGRGPVRCADHLPVLLVQGNEEVAELMGARLLEPMEGLTGTQRRRLCETLLLWLTSGGSPREVGARLGVHQQTIRYRMRRIEELFGDRLRDPTWRLSMALTLFRDQHHEAWDDHHDAL